MNAVAAQNSKDGVGPYLWVVGLEVFIHLSFSSSLFFLKILQLPCIVGETEKFSKQNRNDEGLACYFRD